MTGFLGSAVPIAAVLTLLLAARDSEAGVLGSAGSTVPQARESVLGTFEGRTPCGPIALQFTGFPAENCEKIKWKLTLYSDATSGAPTRYEFQGTRATRRGAWSVVRGTAGNRDAMVYRLEFGPRGSTICLQTIDDRVLLLLDSDRRPLVGDASWSYTLSRTGP
jgi:hypothetical protein